MDVLQERPAKRRLDALQKAAFPGYPESEPDVGLVVAKLALPTAVLPERAVESV